MPNESFEQLNIEFPEEDGRKKENNAENKDVNHSLKSAKEIAMEKAGVSIMPPIAGGSSEGPEIKKPEIKEEKNEFPKIKITGLEKQESGQKKSLKELELLMAEKRRNYIEFYKETPIKMRSYYGQPGDETMEQNKYNGARAAYGKKLYEEAEAEFKKEGKTGKELEIVLKEKRFDIYNKIFLEEEQKIIDAKAEIMPQKEKGIFRKGIEWWMRQNKYVRLAATTAVATGIFTMTGGLAAGAGAMALFAGSRYAKGFISAGVAQLAGKGVDKIFSKVFIEKLKSESEKEIIEEFNPEELTLKKFGEIEANRQTYLEKLAKLERKKLYTKIAVGLAAGVGTSIGLGMLENIYAGGGGYGPKYDPKVEPKAELKADYDYFKDFQEKGGEIKIEDQQIFETNIGSQPVEEISKIGEVGESLEDLAIIKKGEGIWNAVYRQLNERLHNNPEQFGLKSEDLQNTDKIENILNQQTGKLLADQKYFNDVGEIRIAKPGVKVFLDADNKITISGEGKLTYEWQKLVSTEAPVEIPTETSIEPPAELPAETELQAETPVPESEITVEPILGTKEEPFISEPTNAKPPIEAGSQASWPTRTIENSEFGIKSVFNYSSDGKVIGVVVSGKTSGLLESSKLLNDNWRALLIEKGFSGMHTNVIEDRAGVILQYKQLLKTLEEVGNGKGAEAIYLNDKINELMKNTETMYGDVFK